MATVVVGPTRALFSARSNPFRTGSSNSAQSRLSNVPHSFAHGAHNDTAFTHTTPGSLACPQPHRARAHHQNLNTNKQAVAANTPTKPHLHAQRVSSLPRLHPARPKVQLVYAVDEVGRSKQGKHHPLQPVSKHAEAGDTPTQNWASLARCPRTWPTAPMSCCRLPHAFTFPHADNLGSSSPPGPVGFFCFLPRPSHCFHTPHVRPAHT